MKHCPRIPIIVALLLAARSQADAQTDLAEYRTVDKAITAAIAKTKVATGTIPAFLGVQLGVDAQGRAVVEEVAADSPAAASGLLPGDLLLTADGQVVKDGQALHNLLRGKSRGEKIALEVVRLGKKLELAPTLAALSRPRTLSPQAILGIEVVKALQGDGVAIQQVAAGSPAATTKLKVGDIILKADDVALTGPEMLREILANRKPDDTLTLTLSLIGKVSEMKVRLGADQIGAGQAGAEPAGAGKTGKRPGGWDSRVGLNWSKPVYQLAVICVEYPDEKHHPRITSKAWEDSLFSTGTYTTNSVTGQPVYGSVNDVYLEQSFGKLRIEGKVFDFVEVSKKRGEYATGSRLNFLTEATDKLLAREGPDALKKYDGVFFLYAGSRYQAPRGSLYWPHRGTFTHAGKRWPYFICPEGGAKMANISVFAHEFGHMVGLPDLYARPENPGMEGVGQWCMMANQVGNGRPQHFCAWSKEKMGWIRPTLIDPSVKQKLILAPIEDSPRECFKVLVQRDATEYLLLENRAKKGFDKSLPGEGLLIWRVVRNRPVLEESHGVAGSVGPSAYPTSVPFPSAANDSFTPFTTPSSRSHLGGGLPVYITNIRRLPDGRISFHVGYEYQ